MNRYMLDEGNYSGAYSADEGWTQAVRSTVNPVDARDDINSDLGLVRTVVYIGPNLANLNSPKGINLQGIQAELRPSRATGWYWDPVQTACATRSVGISNVMDENEFRNSRQIYLIGNIVSYSCMFFFV